MNLSEKEKESLKEILPHLNTLLHSLGHTDTTFSDINDPILLGAGEYSKNGKLIRKKFGEYMAIFSFLELTNAEGEILRVFCTVDKEGHLLSLNYNYISKEQADLIRGL